MITNNIKRVLKNRLCSNKIQKCSFTTISGVVAIISILLFCFTQLAVNAQLNPKGAMLEQLNNEKNMLIENNRELSEDIAEGKSITIITQIAENQLGMSNQKDQKIYFVPDNSLVAER